jgi:hypothetical protein
VLLGALEHFGLGFYGDPIDDDGDTKTMQNIARWLKPGGWVYFDVPCQPTYSVRPNRHFRDYAPASVQERLIAPSGLTERCRGYSWPEPNAGAWCAEPTEAADAVLVCRRGGGQGVLMAGSIRQHRLDLQTHPAHCRRAVHPAARPAHQHLGSDDPEDRERRSLSARDHRTPLDALGPSVAITSSSTANPTCC